MKNVILILVSIMTITSGFAQVRVNGLVTDKQDGTPLIGVTIREKSGAGGGISDIDGRYIVSVAGSESVLVFSYTGYATQEIALNGRTELNVSMGEDANLLDQVVVVGYGTQRKSDLTGAVGSVKSKDIERIATGSVAQALQGKIAGVYVTPNSGEPGQGAIIRIRGTGTLNNANPIYVIDGMITYDASFVNPQDVASIEVLKDASACAIYGARGANGVVLITTKTGQKRENAVISLNTYYGTQQVTKRIDLLNASEFAQAYNELTNTAYYPDPNALGEGTDWQGEIFRKAPMGNVQLSVNGGTDRFNYNISANYFNQSGILKNSEYERVTLRLNNDFKVNKWLTIGNNLAYSNSKAQLAPGVVTSAYRMPPVFAPKDSLGNFSDPTSPFGLAIANPAADLFYKSNNHNKADRFFGTIYGEIKFLKNFTFKSNFGFDLNSSNEKQFTPIFQVSPSQLNTSDQLWRRFGQGRDWIWEQTVTYDQTWDKHRVTVLAGYTADERTYESFGAGRSGFPGNADELLYLDAGNDTTQVNYGSAHDEALISYLFRTNYTLMDRYLLTVSMRVDQSSRFAADNRTGVFPSASLGWNAGQESFIENLGVVDRLKFRVSYGILGNQNSIRNRYYPSLGVITSRLYYVFGPDEALNQGATLISIGNPDLVWETARQTDIGMEMGFFNNRLSAEIDWYNRYTYDIIAPVPIPDYVGSNEDPIVNTAQVRNRGWDITLNWRQAGRFAWNLGAILSPVSNEVVALNDQKSEILAAFLQGEPATRTVVGEPIGSFYGYKVIGVFDSADEAAGAPRIGNETAGDLQFADLNNDGKIDALDRTNLGSPIPTLTYGFNAGFEVAGFDFAADLLGVTGNKVYNAKKSFRFSVYNWEKSSYTDRWTPTNTAGSVPRITNGGTNYRVSDYFIEDGSFIRLRSMVLGYTLPTALMQRAKINKLRFYVSGNNLWTSQQYSGYSPEFGNDGTPYEVGFDNGGYPIAKSWQFGLEMTF
ncbi:MAG: TonB-dependent receptor [Lewinellaceae bacterium]|nr:TonB-dependent receptor [Lewinellaceae bacterium]